MGNLASIVQNDVQSVEVSWFSQTGWRVVSDCESVPAGSLVRVRVLKRLIAGGDDNDYNDATPINMMFSNGNSQEYVNAFVDDLGNLVAYAYDIDNFNNDGTVDVSILLEVPTPPNQPVGVVNLARKVRVSSLVLNYYNSTDTATSQTDTVEYVQNGIYLDGLTVNTVGNYGAVVPGQNLTGLVTLFSQSQEGTFTYFDLREGYPFAQAPTKVWHAISHAFDTGSVTLNAFQQNTINVKRWFGVTNAIDFTVYNSLAVGLSLTDPDVDPYGVPVVRFCGTAALNNARTIGVTVSGPLPGGAVAAWSVRQNASELLLMNAPTFTGTTITGSLLRIAPKGYYRVVQTATLNGVKRENESGDFLVQNAETRTRPTSNDAWAGTMVPVTPGAESVAAGDFVDVQVEVQCGNEYNGANVPQRIDELLAFLTYFANDALTQTGIRVPLRRVGQTSVWQGRVEMGDELYRQNLSSALLGLALRDEDFCGNKQWKSVNCAFIKYVDVVQPSLLDAEVCLVNSVVPNLEGAHAFLCAAIGQRVAVPLGCVVDASGVSELYIVANYVENGTAKSLDPVRLFVRTAANGSTDFVDIALGTHYEAYLDLCQLNASNIRFSGFTLLLRVDELSPLIQDKMVVVSNYCQIAATDDSYAVYPINLNETGSWLQLTTVDALLVANVAAPYVNINTDGFSALGFYWQNVGFAEVRVPLASIGPLTSFTFNADTTNGSATLTNVYMSEEGWTALTANMQVCAGCWEGCALVSSWNKEARTITFNINSNYTGYDCLFEATVVACTLSEQMQVFVRLSSFNDGSATINSVPDAPYWRQMSLVRINNSDGSINLNDSYWLETYNVKEFESAYVSGSQTNAQSRTQWGAFFRVVDRSCNFAQTTQLVTKIKNEPYATYGAETDNQDEVGGFWLLQDTTAADVNANCCARWAWVSSTSSAATGATVLTNSLQYGTNASAVLIHVPIDAMVDAESGVLQTGAAFQALVTTVSTTQTIPISSTVVSLPVSSASNACDSGCQHLNRAAAMVYGNGTVTFTAYTQYYTGAATSAGAGNNYITVAAISALNGLEAGMYIRDGVSKIAAGTTITSVDTATLRIYLSNNTVGVAGAVAWTASSSKLVNVVADWDVFVSGNGISATGLAGGCYVQAWDAAAKTITLANGTPWLQFATGASTAATYTFNVGNVTVGKLLVRGAGQLVGGWAGANSAIPAVGLYGLHAGSVLSSLVIERAGGAGLAIEGGAPYVAKAHVTSDGVPVVFGEGAVQNAGDLIGEAYLATNALGGPLITASDMYAANKYDINVSNATVAANVPAPEQGLVEINNGGACTLTAFDCADVLHPYRIPNTIVNGDITTSTTWYGIVQVNCEVIVHAGVSLNIAPGTEVRFAYNNTQIGRRPASLVIATGASFYCGGNDDTDAPVCFVPVPVSGVYPDDSGLWGGLVIVGNGNAYRGGNTFNDVPRLFNTIFYDGFHILLPKATGSLNGTTLSGSQPWAVTLQMKALNGGAIQNGTFQNVTTCAVSGISDFRVMTRDAQSLLLQVLNVIALTYGPSDTQIEIKLCPGYESVAVEGALNLDDVSGVQNAQHLPYCPMTFESDPFTATSTQGSPTLTAVTGLDWTQLVVGQPVSGPGVADATVVSWDEPNATVTFSRDANESAVGGNFVLTLTQLSLGECPPLISAYTVTNECEVAPLLIGFEPEEAQYLNPLQLCGKYYFDVNVCKWFTAERYPTELGASSFFMFPVSLDVTTMQARLQGYNETNGVAILTAVLYATAIEQSPLRTDSVRITFNVPADLPVFTDYRLEMQIMDTAAPCVYVPTWLSVLRFVSVVENDVEGADVTCNDAADFTITTPVEIANPDAGLILVADCSPASTPYEVCIRVKRSDLTADGCVASLDDAYIGSLWCPDHEGGLSASSITLSQDGLYYDVCFGCECYYTLGYLQVTYFVTDGVNGLKYEIQDNEGPECVVVNDPSVSSNIITCTQNKLISITPYIMSPGASLCLNGFVCAGTLADAPTFCIGEVTVPEGCPELYSPIFVGLGCVYKPYTPAYYDEIVNVGWPGNVWMMCEEEGRRYRINLIVTKKPAARNGGTGTKYMLTVRPWHNLIVDATAADHAWDFLGSCDNVDLSCRKWRLYVDTELEPSVFAVQVTGTFGATNVTVNAGQNPIPGYLVIGNGVPAGTTVVSYAAPNLVLSNALTSNLTNATLQIVHPNLCVAPTGSECRIPIAVDENNSLIETVGEMGVSVFAPPYAIKRFEGAGEVACAQGILYYLTVPNALAPFLRVGDPVTGTNFQNGTTVQAVLYHGMTDSFSVLLSLPAYGTGSGYAAAFGVNAAAYATITFPIPSAVTLTADSCGLITAGLVQTGDAVVGTNFAAGTTVTTAVGCVLNLNQAVSAAGFSSFRIYINVSNQTVSDTPVAAPMPYLIVPCEDINNLKIGDVLVSAGLPVGTTITDISVEPCQITLSDVPFACGPVTYTIVQGANCLPPWLALKRNSGASIQSSNGYLPLLPNGDCLVADATLFVFEDTADDGDIVGYLKFACGQAPYTVCMLEPDQDDAVNVLRVGEVGQTQFYNNVPVPIVLADNPFPANRNKCTCVDVVVQDACCNSFTYRLFFVYVPRLSAVVKVCNSNEHPLQLLDANDNKTQVDWLQVCCNQETLPNYSMQYQVNGEVLMALSKSNDECYGGYGGETVTPIVTNIERSLTYCGVKQTNTFEPTQSQQTVVSNIEGITVSFSENSRAACSENQATDEQVAAARAAQWWTWCAAGNTEIVSNGLYTTDNSRYFADTWAVQLDTETICANLCTEDSFVVNNIEYAFTIGSGATARRIVFHVQEYLENAREYINKIEAGTVTDCDNTEAVNAPCANEPVYMITETACACINEGWDVLNKCAELPCYDGLRILFFKPLSIEVENYDWRQVCCPYFTNPDALDRVVSRSEAYKYLGRRVLVSGGFSSEFADLVVYETNYVQTCGEGQWENVLDGQENCIEAYKTEVVYSASYDCAPGTIVPAPDGCIAISDCVALDENGHRAITVSRQPGYNFVFYTRACYGSPSEPQLLTAVIDAATVNNIPGYYRDLDAAGQVYDNVTVLSNAWTHGLKVRANMNPESQCDNYMNFVMAMKNVISVYQVDPCSQTSTHEGCLLNFYAFDWLDQFSNCVFPFVISQDDDGNNASIFNLSPRLGWGLCPPIAVSEESAYNPFLLALQKTSETTCPAPAATGSDIETECNGAISIDTYVAWDFSGSIETNALYAIGTDCNANCPPDNGVLQIVVSGAGFTTGSEFTVSKEMHRLRVCAITLPCFDGRELQYSTSNSASTDPCLNLQLPAGDYWWIENVQKAPYYVDVDTENLFNVCNVPESLYYGVPHDQDASAFAVDGADAGATVIYASTLPADVKAGTRLVASYAGAYYLVPGTRVVSVSFDGEVGKYAIIVEPAVYATFEGPLSVAYDTKATECNPLIISRLFACNPNDAPEIPLFRLYNFCFTRETECNADLTCAKLRENVDLCAEDDVAILANIFNCNDLLGPIAGMQFTKVQNGIVYGRPDPNATPNMVHCVKICLVCDQNDVNGTFRDEEDNVIENRRLTTYEGCTGIDPVYFADVCWTTLTPRASECTQSSSADFSFMFPTLNVNLHSSMDCSGDALTARIAVNQLYVQRNSDLYTVSDVQTTGASEFTITVVATDFTPTDISVGGDNATRLLAYLNNHTTDFSSTVELVVQSAQWLDAVNRLMLLNVVTATGVPIEPVQFTGAATGSSNYVTASSSVAGIVAGMPVSGGGLHASATVASVSGAVVYINNTLAQQFVPNAAANTVYSATPAIVNVRFLDSIAVGSDYLLPSEAPSRLLHVSLAAIGDSLDLTAECPHLLDNDVIAAGSIAIDSAFPVRAGLVNNAVFNQIGTTREYFDRISVHKALRVVLKDSVEAPASAQREFGDNEMFGTARTEIAPAGSPWYELNQIATADWDLQTPGFYTLTVKIAGIIGEGANDAYAVKPGTADEPTGYTIHTIGSSVTNATTFRVKINGNYYLALPTANGINAYGGPTNCNYHTIDLALFNCGNAQSNFTQYFPFTGTVQEVAFGVFNTIVTTEGFAGHECVPFAVTLSCAYVECNDDVNFVDFSSYQVRDETGTGYQRQDLYNEPTQSSRAFFYVFASAYECNPEEGLVAAPALFYEVNRLGAAQSFQRSEGAACAPQEYLMLVTNQGDGNIYLRRFLRNTFANSASMKLAIFRPSNGGISTIKSAEMIVRIVLGNGDVSPGSEAWQARDARAVLQAERAETGALAELERARTALSQTPQWIETDRTIMLAARGGARRVTKERIPNPAYETAQTRVENATRAYAASQKQVQSAGRTARNGQGLGWTECIYFYMPRREFANTLDFYKQMNYVLTNLPMVNPDRVAAYLNGTNVTAGELLCYKVSMRINDGPELPAFPLSQCATIYPDVNAFEAAVFPHTVEQVTMTDAITRAVTLANRLNDADRLTSAGGANFSDVLAMRDVSGTVYAQVYRTQVQTFPTVDATDPGECPLLNCVSVDFYSNDTLADIIAVLNNADDYEAVTVADLGIEGASRLTNLLPVLRYFVEQQCVYLPDGSLYTIPVCTATPEDSYNASCGSSGALYAIKRLYEIGALNTVQLYKSVISSYTSTIA